MTGLPEARRRPLLATVRQLRRDVEAAFADRLRMYGIFPSCTASHIHHTRDCYLLPIERLRSPDGDRHLREQLEAIIQREAIGYADLPPSEQTRLAVERYLYEAAATLFNRFAALRAMEARGLIEETIVRRPDFGGRSRREYLTAQSNPGASPQDILEAALRSGFHEASQHISILFDPSDPYALLLPEPRRLIAFLAVFGESITEADWQADDILGWLYQYYQDEAREQFRRGRGRGARRTADADELAAINCLYTPHWVVRALVDNTLGRLLINRTNAGAKSTEQGTSAKDSPYNESVAALCTYVVPTQTTGKATAKPLRSIRILDPASGSGHFLIYAFDVLWGAYRAEEPDRPPEDHAAAILQHNLFGIDIDLRACQLAALGLYLKAKEHAPAMRPVAVNIVCADIRLLDGEREREFLAGFADDTHLRRVAERLLHDLHYTAEIGSLLRVRGAFERLFSERRMTRSRQAKLLEMGIPEQLELEGVAPREKTLAEILDAVARFERHAIERSDMGGQLFAADAERSVGLLSALSAAYDVVLMNPPYNKRQELPPAVRDYLTEHYPLTKHNLYSAFIEQAIALCEPGGYIGCLTPLAYMYLKKFQRLRVDLLAAGAPPELILEFGWDILDPAQIQTAASVLHKEDGSVDLHRLRLFFDLTSYSGSPAKLRAFEDALAEVRSSGDPLACFRVSLAALATVPGCPYAYWLPQTARALFGLHPPLERDNADDSGTAKIADVKQGLTTADDARFTRRWWEVRREQLGPYHWAPFIKGEEYARWYHDPTLVVLWERQGEEIKTYICQRYPYLNGKWEWVAKNPSFYFREGLTWQRVNAGRRVRTRHLPAGGIFADKGPSIFLESGDHYELFALLAFLNSSLANLAMLALTPERGWEVGQVSRLPIAREALESRQLSDAARELHDIHLAWDTGDEISTRFVAPRLLQVAFPDQRGPVTGHPLAVGFEWPSCESWRQIEAIQGSPERSLPDLLALVRSRRRALDERITRLERHVDDEVLRCYGLAAEAEEVKAALDRRLGVTSDDGEEEEVEPEPEPDTGNDELVEVQRLLSHYAHRAVAESDDGIVLWHPRAEGGLVARVRRMFAEEWGEDRGRRIEDEIAGLLDRTMEEWLTLDLFPFHVRLYRNRPVLWLLWSVPRSRGRGRARLPGFACFLDYHRLTRDTLHLVRGLYLARALDEARADAGRRDVQATEARLEGGRNANRLLREAEDARALVVELEEFDERLGSLLERRQPRPTSTTSWVNARVAEICENGYDPNLELGVLVNLQPLRDAGLLHPATNRVT
jgi:hypothetical protein